MGPRVAKDSVWMYGVVRNLEWRHLAVQPGVVGEGLAPARRENWQGVGGGGRKAGRQASVCGERYQGSGCLSLSSSTCPSATAFPTTVVGGGGGKDFR